MKNWNLFFILFLFICWNSKAQQFVVNGINYEITGANEVKVARQDRKSGPVIIPQSVVRAGKTYNVTAIGESAFIFNNKLTAITIPQGIKSIGKQAFDGCALLTSIDLPEGLDSIGEIAFKKCISFTFVKLPNSLKSLEYGVFSECSNLERVIIPSSIKTIGSNAFSYTGLTSVFIPEGITKIEYSAFRDCKELRLVKFPGSLTEIIFEAFYGCSKLLINELPQFAAIGNDAFKGCLNEVEIKRMISEREVIIDYIKYELGKDKARVIAIPGRKYSGNIVIPEKINVKEKTYRVTEIGNNAFSECVQLNKITLPPSIESIGIYAFSNCNNLTEINMPPILKSIGMGAFRSCKRFKEINFPLNITTVDNDAFSNCQFQKITNLPECVISDFDYIFRGSTIDEVVGFPESLVQKTNQKWEETKNKDKIADYQSFINLYPVSVELTTKAKDRMEWQKANPVEVKIDYPRSVKKQNGRYFWKTIFSETGGKGGFKLTATNFYIMDKLGNRWNNTGSYGSGNNTTIEVKKGGRYEYSYWCSDENNTKFRFYEIEWHGTDDWGNIIKIKQEVKFE